MVNVVIETEKRVRTPELWEDVQYANRASRWFAISTLALAAILINAINTQNGGPITLLVAMAAASVLALLHFQNVVRVIISRWWLFPLPLWALLSITWSIEPDVSLRYSLQLVITWLLALIFVGSVRPHHVLRTMLIAMTAFCVLCIADGSQGPSLKGPVLIGLTGSKNQMSYAACLWLFVSLSVLLDRSSAWPFRLLALASAPVATWVIYQGEAATALVTSVIGVVFIFALALVRPFSGAARLALMLAMAAMLAPLSLAPRTVQTALDDFTTQTLGKDPTLTGRTILWDKADELIAEAPMLGHGYETAWRGTTPMSLGLLRWAGVPDGRGFHFHNQVRELWAAIGLVGVVLYLGTLLFTGINLFRAVLHNPGPTASFLTVVYLILSMRSVTEVLLVPFSVDAFLWVMVAAYSPAFARPGSSPGIEPRRSLDPGPSGATNSSAVRTFRGAPAPD